MTNQRAPSGKLISTTKSNRRY